MASPMLRSGGLEVWNPYEKGYGEKRAFHHGSELFRRHAPRLPTSSAQLGAGGSLLLTASWDKTARLFEADTGKLLGKVQHNDVVRRARFSADGDFFVTACDDCYVRVYKSSSLEKVAEQQHRSKATDACFSPDGYLVCTAGKDGTCRILAPRRRPLTRGHRRGSRGSRRSSVASSLGGTGALPEVAETMGAVAEEEQLEESEGEAEEDPFAVGGRWGRLGVWKREKERKELASRHVEKPEATPLPRGPEDPIATLHHELPVLSVAWSSLGHQVCTGAGASRFFGLATVWDAELQVEVTAFDRHEDAVTCVDFTADGRQILSASRDKSARIWSLDEKRELAAFPHPNWVSCVAASPDGKWLLTSCDDGYARVWDVRSRSELRKLPHGGPVTSAHFGMLPADSTNNFKYRTPALPICTASADGVARLFNVQPAN